MPTAIELLLNPISLSMFGMFLFLMLWEAVLPARKLPPIPYWHIKGLASFIVYFFISSYLPFVYAAWCPTFHLLNLSSMNIWTGALVAILLSELGVYVWHRSMHRQKWLWRIFHQMHHSAERIDTYGAFYFSPADMVGWTVLGTVVFSFVTGLPPESITIMLLVSTFLNIFQHANIKTPVWLGYFVQRPESHAIHHQKGVHAYNYCSIPLIDMLFNTFRNPHRYVKENGFYYGASKRIKEMLLFKEVDKPVNN
jgi:sterol desaturase/sphingolipid hydroxylase (fatty acid hydroxylase superfamily)